MTGPEPGGLRDLLAEVAADVAPADLYDGTIRRSRRLGRRRLAASTGATLAALALVGGGLWRLTAPDAPDRAPRQLAAAASVAGLPGSLFYADLAEGKVTRLTLGGALRVVQAAGQSPDATVDVTPDGRLIAALSGGTLRGGSVTGGARTIDRAGLSPGYGPSFSPDGARVLVGQPTGGKPTPGLLDLASGSFAPLPSAAAGHSFRLSGDGRSVVFADPSCRVSIAPVDGGPVRAVPVLGDADRTHNPAGVNACEVFSVSPDASRIAVRLGVVGSPAQGLDELHAANAVVDTRTGQTMAPPDDGSVASALFGPDGLLLYRTQQDETFTLTVVAADGAVVARVAEPATARELELLAYTR